MPFISSETLLLGRMVCTDVVEEDGRRVAGGVGILPFPSARAWRKASHDLLQVRENTFFGGRAIICFVILYIA